MRGWRGWAGAMRWLGPVWLALAGLIGRAGPAEAPRWHTSAYDYVLGTSLELKFEGGSAQDAAVAETAALAEIDRLAAILSGYDASSEFSRWMKTRGEPVHVSPELFEVLALFDAWRERTSGALDAAAEVAGQLWKNAAQRQQLPDKAQLAQAVATAEQTHWRLDAAHQTATHLTDAPLRLNSFAKSYIIEHACQAALRTGKVTTAVVDIGGDLAIRGRVADTVAITDPAAVAENDEPLGQLTARDRAIATSGDYRRGVMIGGKWYSHLVDPRTAQPAAEVRSATVMSPSATDAGALATALCVMAPKDGVKLAEKFPGTDYLIVLADGARIASPGWSGLVAAKQPKVVEAMGAMAAEAGPVGRIEPAGGDDGDIASAGAGSGSNFEVLVNLELASLNGGRTRRPFVAVWIEDKDKHPVRTVSLWFHGPRWLPELRAWYRDEQQRNAAQGSRNPQSISSATRGAGKYTLRWDGTDDAHRALPPGRYTVLIEVAREHGTHQLMTTEIDTSGAGNEVDLGGNTEVADASVQVRGKPGAK